MGLFKNKEDVPMVSPVLSPSPLPPLPTLPPTKEDQRKKVLPELPSFPANVKNENFNQEMVRSAVSDISPPEDAKMYEEASADFNSENVKAESTVSVPPSVQKPLDNIVPVDIKEEGFRPSIVPESKIQIPKVPISPPKQDDPIFIRIDKFQAAQKNFNDIKDKVVEIESILKNIKNVKSQEEVELKGWTEDIEKLKAGLSEIDNDIFSQL